MVHIVRPRQTRLLIRMRAVSLRITWFLGTRMPETFPLTFVTGHPRSGTVWASQLVADYLQLPFPRFSYLPIGFPAVVHGHAPMRDDYPRAVYVVRDPRDVMISQYVHASRIASRYGNNARSLDPNNIAPNLAAYIDRNMNRKGLFSGPMNWAKHVRTYLDCRNDRAALLRYEEMLHNGPEHFAEAMETLTGEPSDMERIHETLHRFSFARQSGRQPGQEDRKSAMRKGKAGDWTNHFSREAAQTLDQHCGKEMIEMGYVEDRSWVDACPPLEDIASYTSTEEV